MKDMFNPAISVFAESSSMRRRTLKDQLADKLIYMISAGLICEGDYLPSERELASTLDVSRETVRGAIQLLVVKGMVEVSQGARTRVCKPPVQNNWKDSFGLDLCDFDVSTVNETRRVVDVAILRSAAINISKKELERLSFLIGSQESMFDDPVAFHISDREFHSLIYKAGKNDLLAKIAADVYSYALDVRHVAMRQNNAIERSVREHMAIYRGLEQHDPDVAERAIVGHLDSIYKSTINALEKNYSLDKK
jgi:DNA-binding FadR family transcriptional regulator